jgi:hypothetical protein
MTIFPTLLLLTSLTGQLEESFQQDFAADLHPMLELVGAEAGGVTKRQATGLLVSLSSDQAAGDDVAVSSKLRLHGDFEITLDYEIASVTKPNKGLGSGVKIWCQIGAGNEQPERITLGHLRSAEHDNAFAAIQARPKSSGKGQHDVHWFDATGKSGKLRLSRTGAHLRYEVAEGASESFRVLHEIDVTDRDVFALRFVVSRHGSSTPLSVKLRQADVRADYLLAPGETQVAKRGVSWIVVYSVLLMLVGGSAGTVWVFRKTLRRVLLKTPSVETVE